MTTRKNGIISAGILAAAFTIMSPAALAGSHGSDHHGHDKPSMERMCNDLQEGKGRFDQEDRRADMDKRRADMAERLQLNDEQRQIWNEIHDERQAEHKQRMDKWEKKLEKRCEQTRK